MENKTEVVVAGATLAGAAVVQGASVDAGIVAVALQPLVQSAVLTTMGIVRGHGEKNMARALQVAQAEANQAADAILQTFTTVERAPVLARIVRAALWSTADEQLRALGRCLASAADDDAELDLELLLVSAIENISAVHIRLLQLVARDRLTGQPDLSALEPRTAPDRFWRPHELAEELGVEGTTVASLAGMLVTHGLLATAATYGGGQAWEALPLGRTLLERAAAAHTAG